MTIKATDYLTKETIGLVDTSRHGVNLAHKYSETTAKNAIVTGVGVTLATIEGQLQDSIKQFVNLAFAYMHHAHMMKELYDLTNDRGDAMLDKIKFVGGILDDVAHLNKLLQHNPADATQEYHINEQSRKRRLAEGAELCQCSACAAQRASEELKHSPELDKSADDVRDVIARMFGIDPSDIKSIHVGEIKAD